MPNFVNAIAFAIICVGAVTAVIVLFQIVALLNKWQDKKFDKRYPTIAESIEKRDKLFRRSGAYWNNNCVSLYRTIRSQREKLATSTAKEKAVLEKSIEENEALLTERSAPYKNMMKEADILTDIVKEFYFRAKIGDPWAYNYLVKMGWDTIFEK